MKGFLASAWRSHLHGRKAALKLSKVKSSLFAPDFHVLALYLVASLCVYNTPMKCMLVLPPALPVKFRFWHRFL